MFCLFAKTKPISDSFATTKCFKFRPSSNNSITMQNLSNILPGTRMGRMKEKKTTLASSKCFYLEEISVLSIYCLHTHSISSHLFILNSLGLLCIRPNVIIGRLKTVSVQELHLKKTPLSYPFLYCVSNFCTVPYSRISNNIP